ncbi:MAG: hypothetical protein L3J79_05295 [Candidatus Marinimicrobia bacterium]|nr:hypothetical protein [Candidatus Neomarinimicrobiota bacterium]
MSSGLVDGQNGGATWAEIGAPMKWKNDQLPTSLHHPDPDIVEGDCSPNIVVKYDKMHTYSRNNRFLVVTDLNAELDILAPTLLPGDFQFQNGNLIETELDEPFNGLESNVNTILDGGINNDPWVEVSNFLDGSTKYFWLVNRRCLPSETQSLTVELNLDDPLSSYVLTDIRSENIDNTEYYFLDPGETEVVIELGPGQGKLFRLSKQSGGTLSSDLTIESYAYVSSDWTIASGVTLTINPGAKIVVAEDVSITISGTLNAVGNAEDPILFNPSESTTDKRFWGGLRANMGTVNLAHVKVQNGIFWAAFVQVKWLHYRSNS